MLEGVSDKWKNMYAYPYYAGYNPNLQHQLNEKSYWVFNFVNKKINLISRV